MEVVVVAVVVVAVVVVAVVVLVLVLVLVDATHTTNGTVWLSLWPWSLPIKMAIAFVVLSSSSLLIMVS